MSLGDAAIRHSAGELPEAEGGDSLSALARGSHTFSAMMTTEFFEYDGEKGYFTFEVQIELLAMGGEVVHDGVDLIAVDLPDGSRVDHLSQGILGLLFAGVAAEFAFFLQREAARVAIEADFYEVERDAIERERDYDAELKFDSDRAEAW